MQISSPKQLGRRHGEVGRIERESVARRELQSGRTEHEQMNAHLSLTLSLTHGIVDGAVADRRYAILVALPR